MFQKTVDGWKKVNLVGSNLLISHNNSLILLKLLDYVHFTLTVLSVYDVSEFLRIHWHVFAASSDNLCFDKSRAQFELLVGICF